MFTWSIVLGSGVIAGLALSIANAIAESGLCTLTLPQH